MKDEKYFEYYRIRTIVTHGYEPFPWMNEHLGEFLDLTEETRTKDGEQCNAVMIIYTKVKGKDAAIVVPKYLTGKQIMKEIKYLNEIGQGTYYVLDEEE